MPINEYDEIITTGKVPGRSNEYLDLVGQDKTLQKQTLQRSMYTSKDLSPDKGADVLRISQKSKLPSDFVERNYDTLKQKENEQTDYDKLINESPATSSYLSNRQNAAVSRDDIDSLTKIEDRVRIVRNRNPIARTGSDITRAATTGWNDLSASTWHLGLAYGLTDIDTAAERIAESNRRSQELRSRVPDYAKEFNETMSKESQDVDKAFNKFSEGYQAQKDGNIRQALSDYSSGAIGTVGEALDMIGAAIIRPRGLAYSTIQNLAHSLPSLVTGAAGSKTGAFAGSKIGAGVALVAGQTGPQVATPEEVVTVPAGAAIGSAIGGVGGFVVGSFAGQVPVEVGSWINEQLQGKGYDLTNPEDIKKAYSNTELIADIRAEAERKGLTTSAVDSVFNLFAGKFATSGTGSIGSKALRTGADVVVQATGETASEFAGQVAAKKGLEGTSLGEAVQEGITSFGHSFGETVIGASARGADISGTVKKVGDQIADTSKKIRGTLSKNPIKAAEEVSQESKKAVQAQQDAQALSDIGEAVKESKTAQRNPDAIKEIIETATKGDEDTNVYFQQTDWDDYWTSKGESPAKKAAEIMGDDGKAYYEAKNNGQDFSIPIADYISKVATTEDFNDLLSFAKTQVDGMSLKEAKDFLSQLPETLDSLAKEVNEQDQIVKEDGEKIAQNISDQLVNAGFEKTTADTYGKLYQSTFSTLSQRSGISIENLFNRFNLKIQRTEFVQPKKEKSIDLKKVRRAEIKQQIEEGSPVFQFKNYVGKKAVFIPEENWNDWKPVIDKLGKRYFTKNKSKGSGIAIDQIAQEFGDQLYGSELSEKELFELLDSSEALTKQKIEEEIDKTISEEDDYVEFLRSQEIKDLFEGISLEAIDELLNSKKILKQHIDTINSLEKDLNLTEEEVRNELNKLRQVINQTGETSKSEVQYFQTAPAVKTTEFKRWFGDSKVVDSNGDPLVVYHGTNTNVQNDFAFDPKKIGLRATAEGYGFYLTNNKEIAKGYQDENGSLIEAYLSMKKPISSKMKRFNKKEISKVINKIVEIEISQFPDEISDYKDSFLSNFVDTYSISKSQAISEVADVLIEGNDTAVDQISELSNVVGDKVTVPKAINKTLGYDGIEVKDFQDGEGTVYVAWFPEQIKSVNNQGTFDPNDPRILFQKNQGIGERIRNMFQKGTDAKGSFQFGNDNFNINLFERADLSTFLHESGHFYLEIMGGLVDSENVTDQIKSDYETILKWLGVDDRSQIKTEHHEKFARGFEAYLMEGKAPSSALRAAFAKFRAWLTSIYRSIRNLDVKLSKDIRGVFDRLLATDEEISVAQEEGNITQIFTSAEQAGMSPEEFSLYENTVREASQKAQEELQNKLIKQYSREQEKWWKDRRDEVRDEVQNEIHSNKDYIALSILQRGKLPDGSELPEGMEPIKISRQSLLETYDKELLKKLPKPFIYSKSDGLHQDVVAEMLGYSSGDELINSILKLVPMNQAIETMTDSRMKDQYGDKLVDGSIAEDARLAVNNDERAKIILAELKALRRLQKEVKPFIKAGEQARKEGVQTAQGSIPSLDVVRQFAKDIIAKKKVRELNPYSHFVSARKASRQAFDALSREQYSEAAKLKQKELLSMELYRESSRIKEEVDRAVDYFKKFGKKSVREKIAKSGSDYLDQIDGLLDRFDFAKGVSLKSIDRRKSLLAWVESQREQGLEPDIPEKLLDETYRMHYKDLSIDELRGLKDSVKNIESFSRLKNRLLKAAKQRAFDEVVEDAVSSIQANSKGKKSVDLETRLPKDEFVRSVKGFFAEHRKFASLIRQMDGFEDGGVMWDILTRPMNDAGDQEAVMNEQATEKLKDIFSVYSPKELTSLYKKQFIPEINDSLTKMAQLSIALNWGNMDSRQKVMDGRQWTQNQVESILDMLDERDWKFVQSVWDFVDSYWAETKALAERVNGVAPDKVLSEPVQTKYGTFPGGYYPLKYDDRLSDRAYENAAKEAADRAMRGAFIRSTTKQGHRKNRVQGVKMPVRLDLGVLFEHVSEIIHDQTHYEFLIDSNKILRDERIKSTIKENYGDIYYRELTKTLDDVAAGNVPAQNAFEKSINWLRSGTSIAAMGWNMMTALQQPLGLSQSMVRIGPKWVAKGVAQWIGSPQKMQQKIDEIYSKSDLMRLRGKTQMREINEIRNTLRLRGRLNAIEDSYFYLIAKAQMIADVPTWLGAYEKAWASDVDMTDEKASKLADQAVLDAQGGGQVKDLADIQRGGPLKKLWTNFYSFFNTTYNLTAESFKKHDIKSPSGIGALAVDMLLLYSLPAILGVLIKDAIKGGDDDEPLPEKLIREQAGYLLGTMVGVRELGSVVQGFYGYEGPAGTRFFGEFGSLIRQIEQGEADEAFWRSANNSAGILLHYPAGQVDRTFRGINALSEGETSNPFVILSGPPRK